MFSLRIIMNRGLYLTIVYSGIIRKIITPRGQGADSPRKLMFTRQDGWSNWKMRYQLRQLCQASKVHKIYKTNFVDLHYNRCNLRIREAIRSRFAERDSSEEFSIIRQLQNFACKTARWGRVMSFQQQKCLYCLSYTQNFAHQLITCYSQN
jgi:hypothetical protein